jgi:hypothetical protein
MAVVLGLAFFHLVYRQLRLVYTRCRPRPHDSAQAADRCAASSKNGAYNMGFVWG